MITNVCVSVCVLCLSVRKTTEEGGDGCPPKLVDMDGSLNFGFDADPWSLSLHVP